MHSNIKKKIGELETKKDQKQGHYEGEEAGREIIRLLDEFDLLSDEEKTAYDTWDPVAFQAFYNDCMAEYYAAHPDKKKEQVATGGGI